jgi:hypothetical protein
MTEDCWAAFVDWLAGEESLTTTEGDHVHADELDTTDLYTNKLLIAPDRPPEHPKQTAGVLRGCQNTRVSGLLVSSHAGEPCHRSAVRLIRSHGRRRGASYL